MACRKVPSGTAGTPDTGEVYATEEECLKHCREGACCTTVAGKTTCAVVPACQCKGAGQVFKGVGTVCTSDLCNPLP